MDNQAPQRKYTIIQAPLLALFSKDFYADVIANWQGSGILLLLSLVAISWTITSFSWDVPLIRLSTNNQTAVFLNQLPKMSLQDGKLTIDKPYPYTIQNPATHSPAILFTQEQHKFELKESDPPIVITSSCVLGKGMEDPIMDFEKLGKVCPNLVLTGPDLLNTLSTLTLWLPAITYALGIIPVFLGHLLQALSYGCLAMIMLNIRKAHLPFSTALRLSVVAMSPVIVLSSMLTALESIGIQCNVVLVAFTPALTITAFCVLSIVLVTGLLIFAVSTTTSTSTVDVEAA